jgi:hypothetical protein
MGQPGARDVRWAAGSTAAPLWNCRMRPVSCPFDVIQKNDQGRVRRKTPVSRCVNPTLR